MLLPLTTALASLVFAGFAWALRFHFASPTMPLGMMAVSIASFGVFGWTLYTFLKLQAVEVGLAGAFALYGLSGALFAWAVSASRSARLRVAFDEIDQAALVEAGPWRFVRHPFYVSYILFWIACALGSGSLVSWLAAPLFAATYVLLARREERGLLASGIGEAYSAYQARTGFMFPRMPR